MADVYRIQVLLNLGGNIAPELSRILKTIDQADRGSKNVGKGISGWASPIDRAAASMGKFAREVANARKGLGTVDREVAKMRQGLSGLKAPAAGLDKEMQKWATAIGRPLAEMRNMRTATQGVGSAARGVSSSIDSWAGRINKATSAMQRMQRAAANVHLPNIPHSVGGGTVGGGSGRRRGGQRGGGSTALQPRAHGSHGGHQYGQHEGSHLAGAMGVYGGLNTLEYLVDQGAGASREDLRAKNAGLTPEENTRLRAKAGELSAMYPSVSQLSIREQGRLLIPNVGNYDTAMKVLPEYIKGQVAMQTLSGPGEGGKDMEAFARYIDIIGRSMSVDDTNKLIDGYVRARQLDPEAIRSNDYVNAAKSAASPGKALNVDFWSTVAPALFSQQGGARTGTDIASAYQNTVVGRASNEALFAQYDAGVRQDLKWHWNKTKTKKVIDHKGGIIDEKLMNAQPFTWTKKILLPIMAQKGMVPEGYGRGDFTQDLSDEQRATSGKFLSDMFSNRRGANVYSMMAQDADQIEQFIKRLKGTRGTADVLSDQKKDAYVAGSAIKTQGGNAGAALSGGSIDDIVGYANRVAAALGKAADVLSNHPVVAGTAFGVGTAAVGGTAAAGIAALTLAGIGTLTLPALTVGAGATVLIAEAIIPWSAIADGMKGMLKEVFPQWYKDNEKQVDGAQKAASWYGTMPGYEKLLLGGQILGGLGKIFTSNLAGTTPEVGSYSFGNRIPGSTPADAKLMPPLAPMPGFSGRMAPLPPMGGSEGAPEQIKAAGDAIGQAGQTAAPSITKAGEAAASAVGGLNSTADGASKAGGALAGLVARISALGSISLPSGAGGGGGGGAGPAASPGAGTATGGGAAPAGGGGASGKTSSVIYRGGAAPIHVATTMTLDQRVLGRSVSKHIVQQADTRNGTGRFDSTSAKTPVGFSEPITA